MLEAGTDMIGKITAPIVEGKPQNLFKQSKKMMNERQALIKQKEEEEKAKAKAKEQEEQAKAKEQEEQIIWEDIKFRQIETENAGINLKENHQVLL